MYRGYGERTMSEALSSHFGAAGKFAQTVVIAALALSVFHLHAPANAATAPTEDEPVLLRADELEHNEDLGIVTARGNVELSQAGRVLLADTVTYNQNADTVTASGNIKLLETTGEVLFSDYAELTDEMKRGFISNLRLRLSDGSRLAANRADRIAGDRKKMERAVFSPCNLCKDDPDRPPLWQIKAKTVTHDEVARDIEYEHAVMEFWGVPVAYSPYFYHPDPTVDRRSGLMVPTIGQSGDLGFIYGQPYYHTFSPQNDLELKPIIYSKKGAILDGRYRHRFANGILDAQGTAAYIDEEDNGVETGDMTGQGSLDIQGRFSLNDTWRTGFDIEHSSKRTYLRRYKLDDREVLTSGLFVEGFRQRNYAIADSYRFQGLRAGDSRSTTPKVLPLLEYDFVGEPDAFGGHFLMNASAASITRDIGTDSQRGSFDLGWNIPYYGPAGDIYDFTVKVQNDIYYASDHTTSTSTTNGFDGTSGRVFPQAGMTWRYPFLRRDRTSSIIIEPIVSMVAGPEDGNDEEIPNEDSQAFEFDETSLFKMNRFEGRDRVTSGGYADYGLKFGVYGDGGGQSTFLIGQSYRFWGENPFNKGSGLEDDLSDIVGNVRVAPSSRLNFLYRFRIDNDDLTPRKNEIGLNWNTPTFGMRADYVVLDEQSSTTQFGDREQVEAGIRLRLSDFWTTTASITHDFSDGENKTRDASVGFEYADECLIFGIVFQQSNIQDEDIEPDNSVFIRISLKHLGGIGAN